MSKGINASPKTLQQAIAHFADPQKCFEYAVKMRWPEGKVTCPRCGSDNHSFIKTRRIWYCNPCKKQFTMKVGTIFEDSPLGMDKWMAAFWMLVNCKNGISSCEVAKDFGITQKSAWFMLHRLRLATQKGSFVKLGGNGGEVEVDETFIGGKARFMHKDRRRRALGCDNPYSFMGKVAVQGLLERHGEVRTRVIGRRNHGVLAAGVRENVEAGATLYSDDAVAYDRLDPDVYKHQVIRHAEKYVDGKIHTNGMENFWSLLKRGIGGTYVSVEPFHLFRYVDEQAFRYNNRKDKTDSERFTEAMSQVFGRRVTWNQLTGKDGAARQDQA
jgi:transposase-like protein